MKNRNKESNDTIKMIILDKLTMLEKAWELVQLIKGWEFNAWKEKNAYYIHLFFTNLTTRRAGVGAKLLIEAEKIAQYNSLKSLILHSPITNVGAISFYQKLEFTIVKEVQDKVSGNIPDYMMKKMILY